MNHASLFSGIGGFDLASEWMGWNNILQCEWDEFCQKILKYYWPNAMLYEDIKKTDFTKHRGTIDILTGGFPCQPYSSAGKRKGTEDDRHLWPEMLRAIREIEPKWVVGENVSGIVSWNGGLVFNEVQVDLETEGYEVQPVLLPASGINAPHHRERCFFIAYSPSTGRAGRASLQVDRCNTNDSKEKSTILHSHKQRNGQMEGVASNPNSKRSFPGKQETARSNFNNIESNSEIPSHSWQHWPTQSPVCSGNDGFSTKLDGIAFPKWRKESIKGFGNAVVPQLVYQIFKVIEKMEESHERQNTTTGN